MLAHIININIVNSLIDILIGAPNFAVVLPAEKNRKKFFRANFEEDKKRMRCANRGCPGLDCTRR